MGYEGGKIKKAVKMATAKLPVQGTPLPDSHVVILISLTIINNVELQKVEALVDLLRQEPPKKVTIALTAGLKGLNFWDFPCYDPKNDSIPFEKSKQAALKLEQEWQEQIRRICVPLNKLTEVNIMLWQDIIAVKNYNDVYQVLLKHYEEDQSCQAAVRKTTENYLKSLKEYDPAKAEEGQCKKTTQIRVDHKKVAREKVLEYLLKEGPLLSKEVLNCDRILYTSHMTPALEKFYNYLNRDTSQECRWWPVRIKDKLLENSTPTQQLVGYSKVRRVKISIGRQKSPEETEAKKKEITEDQQLELQKTFEVSAAAATSNAVGTVSFRLTETDDVQQRAAQVLAELESLITAVDKLGDPSTRTLILSGIDRISQHLTEQPCTKKEDNKPASKSNLCALT